MAGLISDSTLERVRAASDIVDVIGSYLPLKRAGANFVALCPFHKEKSPSFNVNPHKQIFHCFGCHKGGDVFTFVKEHENIGFVDAVRRLADRARIPLELDADPAARQTRHIKDQLLQIHEQITQRWQACLANEAAGQAARDYLAQRGLSAEAIKQFRLGAAPEAWDDTVNWAKGKGLDLAVMEQAGLILKKEETGRHYDRFRGRLMFPICDEQGRVIGFSGRILSNDDKAAKYVNSPETPIFTKSKVFYALDKSKRSILDAGFAVVCEGQLDAIACHQSGVRNVVAPQGTAFTDQHARILKRYADEVVLCFDSDQAGQNAIVRSLDHLLASGLAIRVAVVPAPHDPDSFIKANGAAAFQQLIASAVGFFDFYLDRLCRVNDVTTDRGRLTVVRSMGEAVRKTGHTVLLDNYAQQTALRLGVQPDAVRQEFNKITATANPADDYADAEAAGEATVAPGLPPPAMIESWLLKLALQHEPGLDWLVAHLDPAWIQHSHVRNVVTRRLKAHQESTWRGLAALLDECESPALASLITQWIADERELPNPDQQLADVVLRIRNQFADQQIATLLQQLSQPGITDAQNLQLLGNLQQWRQYKQQPLGPLT